MAFETNENMTAEMILKTLPRIVPLDKGAVFAPRPNLNGVYFLQGMKIKQLPELQWYQLYNITGVRTASAVQPSPTPLPNIYESAVPPPPPPLVVGVPTPIGVPPPPPPPPPLL